MASRKMKSTAYRKHRANTPYSRPKGVLQTVKDWLTPSKWTNPWNEEDEEMMEGEGEVPVVQQEVTETPIPQQQGKPLEDNRPATTGPNDNTQTVEQREELDEVTPIPTFSQKPAHLIDGAVNGLTGASSLKRYPNIPYGATPSLSGRRMFTSTPYVTTNGPITKHVDTPRPPVRTRDQASFVTAPFNRPSFSVSTFHSPTRNLTNLSISHSPFVSPFYSGRTVYGGVANRVGSLRKRPRVTTTPPEDQAPVKQIIKPRPLGGVSDRVSSHTARKILDTLHSMSSPLNDARKLPLRVASPAKKIRLENPLTIKSPPPPVSSLVTPAPPTLSNIKQPLVVLPSLTKPTDQTPVSAPQAPPTPPPSYGKMKTKRQTSHYSRHDHDDEALPTPSFLINPVALTLPSSLTNIPLPGLTTPIHETTPTKGSSPVVTMVIPSPPHQMHSAPSKPQATPSLVLPTPGSYNFTSPLSLTGGPSQQTTPTGEMFEFRPPKPFKETSSEVAPPTQLPLKTGVSVLDALKLPEYQLENIRKESKSTAPPTTTVAPPITTPTIDLTEDSPSKSDSCDVIVTDTVMTTKPAMSVGVVNPAPSISSKGLDVSKGSLKFGTETSLGIGTSLQSGTSLNIATGTSLNIGTGTSLKSGTGTSLNIVTGTSLNIGMGTSLGSGTGTSLRIGTSLGSGTGTSSWECGECWVNNPASNTNCVCCSAPNKKPKDATPTLVPPTLAPPTAAVSTWECPTCMLVNMQDLQSCAACTEKKPGGVVPPISATPTPLKLGDGGGFKIGANLFGAASMPAISLGGKGLKIGSLGGSGLTLGSSVLSLQQLPASEGTTGQTISSKLGQDGGSKGLGISGAGLKFDMSGPPLKLGGESGNITGPLAGGGLKISSLGGSGINIGSSSDASINLIGQQSTSDTPSSKSTNTTTSSNRLPTLSPLVTTSLAGAPFAGSSKMPTLTPFSQSSGLTLSRTPSLGVMSSQTPSLGVMSSRTPSLGVMSSQTPSSGVMSSQTPSLGVMSSQTPSLGLTFPQYSQTPSLTGGISVSKPSISSNTFSNLSFVPPPIASTQTIALPNLTTPTVPNLTTPATSISLGMPSISLSMPSISLGMPTPSGSAIPSLSANLFAIPASTVSGSSQQQQSLFGGNSKPTLAFGQPSGPVTATPIPTSFKTTSSLVFPPPSIAMPTMAPPTGMFNLSVANTAIKPISSGFFNQTLPPTTTSVTGFNFNQTTPSINFANTATPSSLQGTTIFGNSGPTVAPPNQMFEFSGGQPQQQSMFTAGRSSSKGGIREIKKARRRLK